MAGTALKRLMAEYKQLTLNPPEGIVAGPMNEENFFEWEALIMGPEDTCFEFGVFPAILSFPLDYPLSPPKMRFTCEMFHPNTPLSSWQRELFKAFWVPCLWTSDGHPGVCGPLDMVPRPFGESLWYSFKAQKPLEQGRHGKHEGPGVEERLCRTIHISKWSHNTELMSKGELNRFI
ncbi:ubiquitin-conjugating enzyme E2 G2 isoform X2 [Hippopotamus amphibius kiboko]|uniref:ubiquitin-conjugating enzyme E2 G2 isoform X2 n=1 Tax=Hippopotamus amphibius kiboko TaxID=575201 RepID=UPI0025951C89|nr:ubiquitin-conjugating enzyme E2 G2 isoform X2 [Hippopotamus amphibius kiboko]